MDSPSHLDTQPSRDDVADGDHDDSDDGDKPQPRGACPPVTVFDGTPVQAYSSWLVREIGRRVRIADDFPFHLTWAAIKKSRRVDNLFAEIQLQYGLPDQCRDWFFDRARKRWNARKRELKLYYKRFSTHTEAKNNVPLNLGIGAADWLKVTDVFRHANTVPGVDGKTKKELTQKACASQLAPTRMGSQSAKTYRSRYEKKFSKPCTPTIVLDRIYGVADPVSDEEVRDPMSEAVVEIAKKKLPIVLVEARRTSTQGIKSSSITVQTRAQRIQGQRNKYCIDKASAK